MASNLEKDLLLEMLEDFGKSVVKPSAAFTDEFEKFPEEIVSQMANYGLLGLPYPKELGGVGAPYSSYIDTVRILSKYCATCGVIVSAHTSLCCAPIYQYGNEEQKKKYLPSLLKGTHLGAFGLTEPGAGTDASKQRTRATLQGDYYEITGSKIFITNANHADIFIVFAMTNTALKLKGISAFILEKGMPGFTIGPKEKKMGIRGSDTAELIFDKVKVPLANLIGKEGEGFKIAMSTLDGGRIGIAAQALGIAEGAYERMVEYVKTRKQFDQTIASFQNTQFVVADLKTKIEASRLLLYKAASDKENNLPYTQSAAMAKLFCAETACEVATKAIQLHGGYGYIRDYEIERYLRDAKITEIYEGTSEVQKMVISGKELR
ncbi:MAG: acyl-CoA dehydrogenase family protein [Acholeplasmatales bacterium]|jgi:butyryl-CoA dehydrogenase|nr:acyl-CoA dehydrogenase family protein [Acholeplasmatales bacterium]